jgi:uncharacterized protein YqjF (DUF2071 family)
VRLRLPVRHLVLASWPVEPAAIARAVPPGLRPAAVEGRHLVTIAALRFGAGRLGRLPVPPFSQLNVRTYVEHEGATAVFFLRSYVTVGGLGGIFFGAPFKPARIRVDPGRVESRSAGVSLAFRATGAAEPGELGFHELGLYEAGGLKAFVVERGPAAWSAAEPAGPVRADVLLSLGFEPAGEPALAYASDASFATELPSRDASRARR